MSRGKLLIESRLKELTDLIIDKEQKVLETTIMLNKEKVKVASMNKELDQEKHKHELTQQNVEDTIKEKNKYMSNVKKLEDSVLQREREITSLEEKIRENTLMFNTKIKNLEKERDAMTNQLLSIQAELESSKSFLQPQIDKFSRKVIKRQNLIETLKQEIHTMQENYEDLTYRYNEKIKEKDLVLERLARSEKALQSHTLGKLSKLSAGQSDDDSLDEEDDLDRTVEIPVKTIIKMKEVLQRNEELEREIVELQTGNESNFSAQCTKLIEELKAEIKEKDDTLLLQQQLADKYYEKLNQDYQNLLKTNK